MHSAAAAHFGGLSTRVKISVAWFPCLMRSSNFSARPQTRFMPKKSRFSEVHQSERAAGGRDSLPPFTPQDFPV